MYLTFDWLFLFANLIIGHHFILHIGHLPLKFTTNRKETQFTLSFINTVNGFVNPWKFLLGVKHFENYFKEKQCTRKCNKVTTDIKIRSMQSLRKVGTLESLDWYWRQIWFERNIEHVESFMIGKPRSKALLSAKFEL